MNSRPIVIAALAAGFIAGGAAGFFLARRGEIERTERAVVVALEKSGHQTPAPGGRIGGGTTAAGEIAGRPTGIGKTPSTPQDLARAARELLDIGDPFERNQRLTALLESLPMDKAQELFRELGRLLEDGHDVASLSVFQLAAAWLGQRDPKATMASMRTFEDIIGASDDAEVVRLILPSLAARDLGAARQFYESLSHGHLGDKYGTRADVAAMLAVEWQRQDPAGALAWVRGLQDDDERRYALLAIAGREAGRDPAAAIKLMGEIPDEDTRNGAMQNIAKAWALRDPVAAMDWLATQPQDQRDEADHDILRDWAARDAAGAAAWVDKLPTNERGSFLSSIVEGWARRDSAGAAQWIAAQPDGGQKPAAVNDLMTKWLERDGKAATAWLGQQPPGPAKDMGIARVAEHEMQNDPEASLTWLTAIADEGRRVAEISARFQQWHNNDAEAADHWLASTPRLTPEQRQSVQRAKPPEEAPDPFRPPWNKPEKSLERLEK